MQSRTSGATYRATGKETTVDPDFDGIHFRERLSFVKTAIADKLNAQEQMIIELTYTGGFSFEQIGQMLEPRVSRSAVQQTCARALKKVTNELRRRKQLS
jgi:RNA polymerase sigma factor (sigma-70 family)